jgi:hypothetical protein
MLADVHLIRLSGKRVSAAMVVVLVISFAAVLSGQVSVAATPQSITSSDVAAGTPGMPFKFTVTTSGTPLPSITKEGTLPKYLRFIDKGNGTAVISGTTKESGVFYLTITAQFGTGTTKYVAQQAFTLIFASSLTVVPVGPNSSCYGNAELLAWPAAKVAGLTGYQVDFSQPDVDPPQDTYEDVGPGTTVVSFEVAPQELQLAVYPIISGNVSSTSIGSSGLYGYKAPNTMLWNGQNSSVGTESATVSFQWSEEMSYYGNTGGLSDTLLMTASPGGATQTPVLNYPTATATFNGLTPGVTYTFTLSVSNACYPAGGSTVSPEFTPGISPTLTGTPTSPATKGLHYRSSLALGGDPTPSVTVTAGSLPPGLHMSATGVISGNPTKPGTYSATATAYNGVGIQDDGAGATDSFTIQVGA